VAFEGHAPCRPADIDLLIVPAATSNPAVDRGVGTGLGKPVITTNQAALWARWGS